MLWLICIDDHIFDEYCNASEDKEFVIILFIIISLKRNYRHHVVNSVWSLKALDSHVVSDEEIIEDAMFGGRYATKHPEFRVTLFFHTPQVSEFFL